MIYIFKTFYIQIAFQKMKLILELKKRKFVLKSKIHLAEQQIIELKEYIPSFETIISKSKEYEQLTLGLKSELKYNTTNIYH